MPCVLVLGDATNNLHTLKDINNIVNPSPFNNWKKNETNVDIYNIVNLLLSTTGKRMKQ